VEAQGIVDCEHEVRRHGTEFVGDTVDGHGADLFGLGFAVTVEAGLGSGEQHLEGIHDVDLGADGLGAGDGNAESFGELVDQHVDLAEELHGVPLVGEFSRAWRCAGVARSRKLNMPADRMERPHGGHVSNPRHRHLLVLAAFLLAVASCGGDDDLATTTAAPGQGGGPVANACPADGCSISIVSVTRQGEELAVTWEANFDPDVSRNHIHVYWDLYTADQVSSDAEARGVEQGDWAPTDAYPTYVTESAASVANRGDSTTLCVTAGDRDHAVIDSSIVDCADVSGEL